MSKADAKKIAKKFGARLKAENYPFSAIYLFGSYANGGSREGSDIDIAVFSEKLKKNWNENEELLWKIGVDVDSRIEPVGFIPEDFENEVDPMVREIKKNGVRVI